MDNHKYLLVVNFIKELILNNKVRYGEKIMSENQLAEQFGISRQTVRQAVGILQNEGFLSSVRGSGTFVSKRNAENKRRSNNIGVIITFPDEYIFPTIIKGIESVLSQNGYSVNLYFTGNKVEREAACLRALLEKDIDGIIAEGTKTALPSPNLGLYQKLINKGIPLVFINGEYKDFPSSYVIMDDEKGGFIATEYLIKNGHRNIGGIFKADDIQGHRRYKGYIDACARYGIEISEDTVLWYTTEQFESVLGDCEFLSDRLKSSSAVVCYNDQAALKLCDVLKGNFKIPDDISVISFDDSSLAEIATVKLTTVAHAGAKLGEKAADAVISGINSGSLSEIILNPELIIRDSVKNLL